MDDPYDLARFVSAQAGAYEMAIRELRTARQEHHWMWFVFPQIAGLGMTSMSRHYAIRSLDEARAYLEHPVLGRRLRECAGILLEAPPTASADSIFSDIDALKLRSSMTLFLRAAPREALWQRVLDRFYGGAADPRTDELLRIGS